MSADLQVAPDVLRVLDPTAKKFGDGFHPLAPRPSSLGGLTLGLLWNGKPMGDVALKRAGALLQELVPDLGVRFYVGALPSGPKLLATVAEECDVVIACTADCGSCTSWLTYDCVQLERRGVPTTIIASAGFEEDLIASAKAFAMPNMPFVVVPLVYNNLTAEQTVEQTEPVISELATLLTRQTGPAAATPADIVDGVETFAPTNGTSVQLAYNRAVLERDWTDGYPVWPPTRDAVDRLVDAVDGAPDDVVCLLPPGNGEATVERIATNAAMAGCEPGEMPVIMAALRALANTEYQQLFRVALMSTSSHAPMVMVNGPIAAELGINGGRCCLGPGRQNAVNIRISRAIVMSLKNIGRWYPGVMDLDSIGSPRKNIAVFAENEAESPWDPFHVDAGYAPTESTVTVLFSSGEWDISMQGHLDADQLARGIGSFSGGNNSFGYMTTLFGDQDLKIGRLLLLAPPHARPLAEGGFTKKALENYLYQLGQEPVHRLIEPIRKLHADGKVRKEYEWLFRLPEEVARTMTMPVLERSELYKVVVVGSVRAKDILIPTRTPPFTEKVTRTPGGT